MIYTELTKRAMKICYEAHQNQVDKGGTPYVFHPFHIAEQMDDEISTCVALLHDTVEGGGEDYAYLICSSGFPKKVIDAVIALTKPHHKYYMDYIFGLSFNPIARKVKMADLKHDLDSTRLNKVTVRDENRILLYKRALAYLEKAERNHYERIPDEARNEYYGGVK